MSKRGPVTEPAVGALAQHLIERLQADGKTLDEIGALLGVSKTAVIDVRDGGRGAGLKIEKGLAKVFFRGSIDETRRAAKDFAEAGRLPYELEPEVYPLRQSALARLRGILLPEVETVVRQASPPGAEGWSEADWIFYAMEEHRRALLRPARSKVVALEDKRAERDTREAVDKTTPPPIPTESEKEKARKPKH